MSKIWAMGVPLDDVVAMTTVNPAATVGRAHELGTLEVGRVADVSVLRIEEGDDIELSDGYELIPAERRLAPVGCVRAGEWIAAA
jgi:dihydroorotase